MEFTIAGILVHVLCCLLPQEYSHFSILAFTSKMDEEQVQLLAKHSRQLRTNPWISQCAELAMSVLSKVNLSKNKFQSAQVPLSFLAASFYKTILSSGSASLEGIRTVQISDAYVAKWMYRQFQGLVCSRQERFASSRTCFWTVLEVRMSISLMKECRLQEDTTKMQHNHLECF